MNLTIYTSGINPKVLWKENLLQVFTSSSKNTTRRTSHEFGTFSFKRTKGHGYTLWHNTIMPLEDITISVETKNPFLGLGILYKSGMLIKFKKDELSFPQKHFFFAYLPEVVYTSNTLKNSEYGNISIHFSAYLIKGFIKQYPNFEFLLHSALTREPYLSINEGFNLTIKMQMVVDEIVKDNFSVNYRDMLIELRVKELLIRAIEQMNNWTEEPVLKLSSQEIEIIKTLPVLIMSNIHNPLTIKILQKKTGLNATKLKKGFKRLYGMTINAYSIKIRMEKAQAMLIESNLAVAEIGEQVGYKNTSAFTFAFKNYFKYTPVEFRIGNAKK